MNSTAPSFFFFSSRRRHTRWPRDWSSDVCSSDLAEAARTRLMAIFDLTHVQAEYILELRLRRLTKFSQVDLEAERSEERRVGKESRAGGGPDRGDEEGVQKRGCGGRRSS